MLFLALLAAASLLGGLPGAVLSNAPRRKLPLAALLLAAVSTALFLAALLLRAHTWNLTAAIDRFFPDRPAKLLGCAALFALCCGLGLLVGLLRARGLGRYFRRVSGSRPHRTAVLAAFGGLLLLSAAWALLVWTPSPAPIRLNELCCANFARPDPDAGDYADYVELVNTGDAPVSLEGYYISDNPKKRNRFRLPARTLEPGQTLLLWADGAGKSGKDLGVAVHLSFTLKPGETVYLSSPRGALLDEARVPARKKNLALSRLDGSWTLTEATPGSPNEGAALYTAPTLDPPALSLPSGFYDDAVTVTLSAAPGCEIRYTLDGSVPRADSPLYTAPLRLTDVSDQPNRVVSQPNTTADRSGAVTEPVDKATVLRAAAFDAAGRFSEPAAAVYFIGKARFAKYEGRAVLNITADPEDLFGDQGILVTGPAYDAWLEAGGEGPAPTANYQLQGRISERDAALQLFDEAHSPLLDSPCGLRVQGASTRIYATKRFTLYARPVYGTDRLFSVPIFGETRSHAFSTRPTAHEAMAQALAAKRGLGGLDARAASVFLNGEFYTDTWLRERYDAQYFENHYGVAEKDLILVENDLPGLGTPEDYQAYVALMDEILNGDCSDPAFYAEVCKRIDPESYAAFMAVNLYLKNTDWSNLVNYKLWRTRSPKGEGVLDGRWHWLAFDMDSCFWTREAFGDAPRASYDIFSYPSVLTGHSFEETPLFRALLKSPAFRTLFAQTWLELLNVSFTYENSLPLLERFGLTEDAFWPEFLQDRPAYALDQLIQHILPEAAPCALTLKASSPGSGSLLLDGLPITDPRMDDTLPSASPSLTDRRDGTLPSGPPQADNLPQANPSAPWTGAWVTGVPLTLTARPAEGWRFLRWTGSVESTDQTLTLTPTADLTLTAVFEPIAP